MSISVCCPQCRYQFRVPDHVAGQRGKCPKCKAIFLAQPAGAAAAPAPAATQAAPAAPATVASSSTTAASAADAQRVRPRMLIPKPRLLEKMAVSTDAPPASKPVADVAPIPASATNGPPPLPPSPARSPLPESSALATSESGKALPVDAPRLYLAAEPAAAASGGAPVYPHRRAKKSKLPLLVAAASIALALLVGVGLGVLWPRLFPTPTIAQHNLAAENTSTALNPKNSRTTRDDFSAFGANDVDNDGDEGAIPFGGEGPRAVFRPLPEEARNLDVRGDVDSLLPAAEPEPLRPLVPLETEDDPLVGALEKFGQLSELLAAKDWRPKTADEYAGFAEFAHQSTELTAMIDKLEPVRQAESRQAVSRALEQLADAPWPTADEQAAVNRLAAAGLPGGEAPGIFAFGQCLLRPEDFGDYSIDGLPLFAFELPGTDAIIVMPIGENGAEIETGSQWLIIGTKDPDDTVVITPPDAPDAKREAAIIRAKTILGRPGP